MNNDTPELTPEQLTAMSWEDLEKHIKIKRQAVSRQVSDLWNLLYQQIEDQTAALEKTLTQVQYDFEVDMQRLREDWKAAQDE
jgi:hypothetical protein